MTNPLPTYADDALPDMSADELVRILIRNEDRVPRNVIDECARRGDAMLDALADRLRKDYYWTEDVSGGEWWLAIHAAMILGLLESERAGELLVELMRRLGEDGDDNRLSWITDHWPALFRNKPASVMTALRDIAEDRELDVLVRTDAVESVIAITGKLDEALTWGAQIAFDPNEDLEVRAFIGNLLVDFPRPEYRSRLEQLAREHEEFSVFDLDDVRDAYREGRDHPRWDQRRDPWRFYAPEEIESRQLRWVQEEAQRAKFIAEDPFEPYVRETPKIGRNDPCPCGSGKKYKKCCMDA
jgi:hypothetical protein